MVQWQLSTLDHLKFSGFGCPPPRHGLQLLFWFANECIKHDDNQRVVELVTECQPDRGDYGFHPFGNIEEILPVLRGRSKKKKRGAYFEVGNLNTPTYPASDDLPNYVKENYGLRGRRRNNNLDRIIISYNIRTKIVDMVYITEHDTAVSGRFSPERTHTINPELIRTLQDIQLDVFLTVTGYYNNVDHGSNIVQTFHQQPWVAQYIDSDHIHGSSVQSQQTDNFHSYYPATSEYSQQIAKANIRPMSYREQVTDFLRGIITSNFTEPEGDFIRSLGNSQHAAAMEYIYGTRSSVYSQRHDYKRSPAIMGTREFAGTPGFFWDSGFYARERGSERGSEKDDKKWRKLAMVLGKALLAAGALYLGAKSVSWLSGGGGKHLDSTSISGSVIRRPHVFTDIPIMMFYVL